MNELPRQSWPRCSTVNNCIIPPNFELQCSICGNAQIRSHWLYLAAFFFSEKWRNFYGVLLTPLVQLNLGGDHPDPRHHLCITFFCASGLSVAIDGKKGDP